MPAPVAHLRRRPRRSAQAVAALLVALALAPVALGACGGKDDGGAVDTNGTAPLRPGATYPPSTPATTAP